MSKVELSASGFKLVLGFKFNDPVFMHAITIVADMFNGISYAHSNTNELLQNYDIYIGENENYSQNTRCAGGPFLKINDPNSYVFDDFAAFST